MDRLCFAFFLSLFWMPCVPGAKLTPAKRDWQTLEETVESPGHYEGSYNNKHDMYWLIQAPEEQRIYLIFRYLPSGNTNCSPDSEDHVQIEDTQIHCGHKPITIVSQTNELDIFFVTDQSGTSRKFRFYCYFFSKSLLPTLHNSDRCGWIEDRRKRNQEIEELVKRGFNKKEADEVSWLVRRIFHGKKSEHGEWPWLVSVYKSDDHVEEEKGHIRGEEHICGGTLIHPQWVLTAAHCFEDSDVNPTETHDYILRVGDHSINEKDDTEFSRHPDHIFIHPHRNDKTNAWDFALVKLEYPVPLNDHVGLVCLPTKDDHFKGNCVAAGWGETELGDSYNGTVRHVDLSIVDNQGCANSYKGKGADEVASHIELAEDVLCAGGQGNTGGEGYKDTCTGDSGGPLVCTVEEEDIDYGYVLAGVTSAGIECGKGLPGLYGRVTSALPWIYETVIEHEHDDKKRYVGVSRQILTKV